MAFVLIGQESEADPPIAMVHGLEAYEGFRVLCHEHAISCILEDVFMPELLLNQACKAYPGGFEAIQIETDGRFAFELRWVSRRTRMLMSEDVGAAGLLM